MTTEYTDHFRLNLPDFRTGPWHDLVNEDFVMIDGLLFSIYQGVDTQPWDNNKHFKPGDTAIDPDDGTFWVCIVEHTSAPTGTFAADRAAHPTYWNRVVVGVAPRGEWTNNTHYLPNDMVSDSVEHVIAIAKDEHTSNASGTIRDDSAHWTFVADMGPLAAQADQVTYDNSVSGVSHTNLQATTDDLYAKNASQQTAINTNTANISNLTPRVTALESSDATQTANIATNASNITALQTSTSAGFAANATKDNAQDTAIAALQSAGYIADAPSDGKIYGRQNAHWQEVSGSGGGSSVFVSDTPPADAPDNSLWWESDSGLLYVRYNDGDSTQWVLAFPMPDTSGFVSKTGDTMTGQLSLSPATGPAQMILSPSVAAQQASIIFAQGGVTKWQFGKQTDDSVFLYDNVGGSYVFSSPSNVNALTLGKNTVVNGAVQAVGTINAGYAGTTGTYYFGNSGTKYLSYDGSNYGLVGGALTVAGNVSANSLVASGAVWSMGTATTGTYYFGNSGTRYLTYDGTSYTLAGGTLVVAGAAPHVALNSTTTPANASYDIYLNGGPKWAIGCQVGDGTGNLSFYTYAGTKQMLTLTEGGIANFPGVTVCAGTSTGRYFSGNTASATNIEKYYAYFDGATNWGFTSYDVNAATGSFTTAFAIYRNTVQVGTIQCNGSSTIYNTASDEALKDVKGPYTPEQAIAIIRADPVLMWNWKESGDPGIGWVAQKSYAVDPDLAAPPPAMSAPKDAPEGFEMPLQMWGIDYGKRTPYLWAAVSSLLDRIDALEAKLAALETKPV